MKLQQQSNYKSNDHSYMVYRNSMSEFNKKNITNNGKNKNTNLGNCIKQTLK